MSRYTNAFAAAAAEGGPLFMPYLTAGFPQLDDTVPLVQALVAGGAGALELGVPFSDPLADGPTVQRAGTAALAQGVDVAFCLETVRRLRRAGVEVPITLMGYINPFLAYGRAHGGADGGDDGGPVLAPLARDAARAGADGFIIVDLPAEESDAHRAAIEAEGLALIYLLAPTSTEARIAAVASRASGFLYLVSVTGVTGARDALPDDLVDFVARVRALSDLPLAVGFGLSTRAQVETVGELCEAAVIGSAVISTIEEAQPADRAAALQRYAEVVTGRRREDRER